MRSFPHSALLFVVFCRVAIGSAQTTPLPAGTSTPGDVGTTVTAADRSSAHAAELISQAEDAIVRNQYDKALPLLSEALAATQPISPQAGRAFYDRGYIEQQQNQTPAAEADFSKANLADPKQFESHAALGTLLAQQQQWKESRNQLHLAAGLQPASGDRVQALAEVDRTLARVDAQLHDTAAASDALLAALKLTPEQTDDTFLAAQLAEDQNNYPGAEQEYKKVLAADPKLIAAAEGLARAYIHQQQFSDAEPVLALALQQEPNDPVLLAQSATALAGEGKTDAAIPQLEALHQQNPNQPAVTRMLADLYSTAGDAAKADPLYRQLLVTDAQNPGLLTALGENQVHELKWADAIESFEQSLSIQPQQGDAWSGLAYAASENLQYSLVLSALDHRDEYLPEVPATLFLRATALDHLHHTKQAIAFYQQFLAAAQGKFPDEESQTRQRITELQKSH